MPEPLTLREYIASRTHGNPPDRACLPNRSDREWDTYMLGVEEATCAAEEYARGETDGQASTYCPSCSDMRGVPLARRMGGCTCDAGETDA